MSEDTKTPHDSIKYCQDFWAGAIDDEDEIDHCIRKANAEKADPNTLHTPWTLHFDRDGTEDYGIICDAEGNDLVASHITGSKTPPRWKAREFGDGCFWLPEEDDPVPLLVRQMRLMTAAPKLLGVAHRLREICGIQANLCSTATEAERLRFIQLVFDLVNGLTAEAIAEATGNVAEETDAE